MLTMLQKEKRSRLTSYKDPHSRLRVLLINSVAACINHHCGGETGSNGC